MSRAATLPSGFQDVVVFSGLNHPTAFRFAPDGRVFVAEKGGAIKVFASLTATSPTLFADLSAQVDDFWDRGLLGLEVDPQFPTNPYIYALYSYDAPIGGSAPAWNDNCPTPPGATTDGCLISGRLSRLKADATGNQMVSGGEQVLINDWCQQFPSHSIGTLMFGLDGMLYASGGEGASFNNVDFGQYGNTYAGDQANPCGDPPGSVGTALTTPTAEGGALRSQSVRRPSGEPVSLDGAILRLDPRDGAALPTNPLYNTNPNTNAKRIVGYGLRNPFRFTIRPGTNEIWAGDVGWGGWEEINRISSPTVSSVNNFGWPCYEGNTISYQGTDLNLCSSLYSAGSATAPYYTYQHGVQVVSGETCPTANGSAITGLAFYNGGTYPTAYNGTLFFADHSRNCIWAMQSGSNGLPDTNKISTFIAAASNPVDLEIGPGGDLFYADLEGGAIHRITYAGAGNQPPIAVIRANPTNGSAPLTVNFDGTQSYDPDQGDSITAYSWDFGDGTTGSGATITHTYTKAGNYTATLKVTDKHSATGSSTIVIGASNTPPTVSIDTVQINGTALTSPSSCSFASSACWAVGDTIGFSGSATDQLDGTNLSTSWKWIIHHCPTDINSCHAHDAGVGSGTSGSFPAPDHEYPSYLELQLTATDSGGLQSSASVLLYPKTVSLSFQTSPTGLRLTVNSTSASAPFNRTVILGSNNSLSAPSPQYLNGHRYAFAAWSDGGAQSHSVTANSAATYTATYADQGLALGVPSNLIATATAKNKMSLRWTDNSTDETGFKIERSTDNITFGQIATVGTNITSYTNTGLRAGTTYYYRVRAYNTSGNSDYSNTATATTPNR